MFRLHKRKTQITHRCKKCGEHGICAAHTFHVHLQRERDRADRSGLMFSLVVFQLPDTPERHTLGERLVDTILVRLRLTDYAGWIDRAQIGVILVDTPASGARIFTDYIIRALPSGFPRPEIHIYNYPDDSGDEDQRQMWFGDLDNVRQDPAAASLSRAPQAPAEIAPAAARRSANSENAKADLHIADYIAKPLPRWKRAMDIAVAGTALLPAAPLMLVIAAAIKCSSKGPALFKQQRIGYKGCLFDCYKFRTMHLNADAKIHRQHLQQLMKSNQKLTKLDKGRDPRVFAVGRWLRSSSLDELPQLINVLKGEMSLIGPRPAIPYEHKQFQPWHRHRVDALPGLTGLWQVSGKNKTTFAEMMRFDRAYTQDETLTQDARIICKTPAVVLEQLLDDLRARHGDRHARTGDKKHAAA
jgi:lipopolysaccharide/colanic/teichoic acid biosynthesis glycosyltransferase